MNRRSEVTVINLVVQPKLKEKIVLAFIAVASLCALSFCSHDSEENGSNGGTVKLISIASDTNINTPNDNCINFTGNDYDVWPTSASTQ